MPVDFDPGGPLASVNFGDGVTDKIKFEADDASCMWNGFPVSLVCCPLECVIPADPQPATQILDWVTAATAGVQTPPEATWPLLRVYDYLDTILCGYHLEVRIRFTVSSGRGDYAVVNPYTGAYAPGFQDTGPAVVAIDSGWQDARGPDCAQAAAATDGVVTFGLAWFNFNPTISDGIINGVLEGRWIATSSTPIADFAPFQQEEIVWFPPSCQLGEGLSIHLPTNSCGVVTKTYTQIKNDVNALALGLTATTLGGHGGDTAAPDPSSSVKPDCNAAANYGKEMGGADCTGGTDYRQGMQTP